MTVVSDANYRVVSGATGKEVVILDLYKGTGDVHLSKQGYDLN